jgi:hypothetical protein
VGAERERRPNLAELSSVFATVAWLKYRVVLETKRLAQPIGCPEIREFASLVSLEPFPRIRVTTGQRSPATQI